MPGADVDRYGLYTPEEFEARWLRFELISDLDVPRQLFEPIFFEAFRVEPLLNRSSEWRSWWTATSKAPAVDVGVCIAWPDRVTFPEKVSRGRKQHHVRIILEAGCAQGTAEADRKQLLLPTVHEALQRLIVKLKLAPSPTKFPDGVAPGPSK